MKLAIYITLLSLAFACSPYQKLIYYPAKRNSILLDSCDSLLISQMKQTLELMDPGSPFDPAALPDATPEAPGCRYDAVEVLPPRADSSIWLLAIRPATVGRDEIILGSLYTFYPGQDSTFTFIRRIKEYSQNREFEGGKYMVFTYYYQNDSLTVVKAGKNTF